MYKHKITGATLSNEEYEYMLNLLWTSQWNNNSNNIVKKFKKEGNNLQEYILYMKQNYKDPEYEYIKTLRYFD